MSIYCSWFCFIQSIAVRREDCPCHRNPRLTDALLHPCHWGENIVIEVRLLWFSLNLRWDYYDWGEIMTNMYVYVAFRKHLYFTVTSIFKWSIISHPRLSRPPPSPCPCLAATSSSPWWASSPTSLTSHTNWSSRNNDGVHPQPPKKALDFVDFSFEILICWYINPCRCWWLYQCVLPP